MKPVSICLAPPTSSNNPLEMPTLNQIGVMVTSAINLTTNIRNVSNPSGFYTCTPSSSLAPLQATQGPFMNLMVAKLPVTRPPSVILQSRSNLVRANVALPTLRGPATVQLSQNLPLSGSSIAPTSAISVRTRNIPGVQAITSLPGSVVHLPNQSGTINAQVFANSSAFKQIVTTGQQKVTGGETVNLVITNSHDGRGNSKTNQIFLNQEIKTNVPAVHNLTKVNGTAQKTIAVPSPAQVVPPKMFNISHSGSNTAAACQRLLGAVNPGGASKSNVINLTPSSMPKSSFIITSQNSHGGMVGGSALAMNISSANFVSANQQPTKISMNANHIIAASKQMIVTSSGEVIMSTQANHHLGQPVSSSSVAGYKPTVYAVATSSVMNHNVTPSIALMTQPGTGSTLPLNAPQKTLETSSVVPSSVKLSPQIVTSPRPRILSRKRINDASPSSYAIQSKNGPIVLFNNSSAEQQQPTSSATVLVTQNYVPMNQQQQSLQVQQELSIHQQHQKSASTEDRPPTPRKKPRKQLFDSVNETHADDASSHTIKPLESQTHESGDSGTSHATEQKTILKRPRPSLLNSFNYQLKPAQHFLRPTDVKVRTDNKKLSVSDMVQNVSKQNGWRNTILSTQLHNSAGDEYSLVQKPLENFLKLLEEEVSPYSKIASKSTLYGNQAVSENLSFIDRISVKINDLTRANIQRNKIIIDNLNEAKQVLTKVTTDHREKLSLCTKRIAHKRSLAK